MIDQEKMIKGMKPPVEAGKRDEADGPQRPPLAAPPETGLPPVERGDRIEEIGAFGSLTGEAGTVIAANEREAVVKWDDDGRELLGQRYLVKTTGTA